MFLIDIFKIILNILYLPFKCLKKKNKILFLSRQTNQVSLEYSMLIKELSKNDNIEIVTITKKIERNLKSYIFNFFLLFKQMYHLGTSKVVITDGYSVPISILKHRKDLIIIQMWHANGIIKKIGLQTLEKRSKKQKKLAIKMNMHKNYNYVISSSKHSSVVFSKAFNVNLKNILNFGTPMLDYIYYKKNDKSKEIKEKYNLYDKKIIVYLPTYRKNMIDYNILLKNIDFNKYYLVMKKHPVDKLNIIDDRIIMINDYIAEDLISVADYVISDYSNVVFESILSNKKTFCYIYDYEEYKKDFGLNIDIKKQFKYAFYNITDLVENLDNDYNMQYALHFTKKYVENFDGKCTDRIISFIEKIMIK